MIDTRRLAGPSVVRRQFLTSIFVLFFLLLAVPLLAAPPANKGAGKGGGDASGPVPERHFKWRVRLNGSYSRVRPALGPDGTIYAVDVHDQLVAVSPDGKVLWSAADAGSKGVDVGPDGTVYTGNENWIKAYNSDGSLKWKYVQDPRAFVLIDVAAGPDGHLYAVATSGMGVFSLADLGDRPELRWTNPEVYSRPFTGYTELTFGPSSDGLDQQLYFYANGHTRAVRLSDGASVFTLGGGNTQPRVSPFDGTWHRPASAFTPDGEPVWTFEFPLATGTTEPVLGPTGTHYAVNSGNVLYAIDPTGLADWQAALDEFVGLPDVDPAESSVILNAGGGTTNPAALKAVSAANGSPLWRMEFPPDETGLDQFVDSGVAFSTHGTTAYVMTAIASGTGMSRSYLNAVDIDPTIPSASTVLRSTEVVLEARSRRNGVSFTGDVIVMDENRGPISGATVRATWTPPDGTKIDQAATTSGGGAVRFSLTGAGGLYRLTVTDISKEGYVFDPRHSVLEGAKAWF